MFERFTDRARRVVVLAQEEARILNHDYIGTEHLLLGLLSEGEGVAAQALAALGVALDEARAKVIEMIGEGSGGPVKGHIPFTPRGKKVLEMSLREAMKLGHNYIGTEHILLGLLREGEGVGAQVLQSHGVGLDQARVKVIEILGGKARPRASRVGPFTVDVVQRLGLTEALRRWATVEGDFTERAKRAASFAREEADSRGGDQIDVEDLLVALMREEGTLASLVLKSFGLSNEALRDRIRELREPGPEGEAAEG